jgi:hypothetical protein
MDSENNRIQEDCAHWDCVTQICTLERGDCLDCGDFKPALRGWHDVFDELTYTDGPGDNIYVYG